MAKATSTKTDIAGRRVAKKGEPRLARYAEKEVTPVIDFYGDWIEKEVGLTLSKRDRQILFIGSALRGEFQKSPENQKRIADRKDEIVAEQEAREQRAAEREERRAAKEAAKAAKAAQPKAEKTAKAAPTKKAASKTAATKSAPAKTGTTRRRPATKSSNADF